MVPGKIQWMMNDETRTNCLSPKHGYIQLYSAEKTYCKAPNHATYAAKIRILNIGNTAHMISR